MNKIIDSNKQKKKHTDVSYLSLFSNHTEMQSKDGNSTLL